MSLLVSNCGMYVYTYALIVSKKSFEVVATYGYIAIQLVNYLVFSDDLLGY